MFPNYVPKRDRLILLFVLLFSILLPLFAVPCFAQCALPDRINLVFWGQSNIVGQGPTSETPPAVPNASRIELFANDYRFYLPATEPVDTPFPLPGGGYGQVDGVSRDTAPNVGPARYVADRLLEFASASSTVTIVMCAKGGLGANYWKPIPDGSTQINERVRALLWGSCLDRTLTVIALRGPLLAVITRIGEADANQATSVDADLWEERVDASISRLREFLGTPWLPLFYARFEPNAPTPGYAFWSTVIAEQDALASAVNVPVQAARTPVGVHLTAADNAVWGRAVADAILERAGCL